MQVASTQTNNMAGKATLKIIPSEKVLAENERIQCTIPNCTSTFTRLSNYQMHMDKHHGIKSKNISMEDTNIQYYCPVRECKYNVQDNDGTHFFKVKKYIRQHYLKVHAVKNVKCSKCEKAFGNETLKKQHERVCGIVFKCIDCDWNYTTRECLLTHCRRKGHRTPPKEPFKKPTPEQLAPPKRAQQATQLMPRKIKPKIMETDKKSIDLVDDSPVSRIKANFQRIMEKHRQTTEVKISQTTQTTQNIQIVYQHPTLASFSSIATAPEDTYKNLDLIDEETSNSLNDAVQANKNLNNLHFCEDDSSLQYFTVNNFNVGLCHIETQTELMPFDGADMETSELDPLLCHMHTQTSDELLRDLGFGRIRTQSNDPNDFLFVSTQTQTCFEEPPADNTSTETQTMNTDFTIPPCPELIWPKTNNQCTQTQELK